MARSWASRLGNRTNYLHGDAARILRNAQLIIKTPSTFSSGAPARNIRGAPVVVTSPFAASWSLNGAIGKSIADLGMDGQLKHWIEHCIDDAVAQAGIDSTNAPDSWTFNEAHQALAWALERQDWPTAAQVLRQLRKNLLKCKLHDDRETCSDDCRTWIQSAYTGDWLFENLFKICSEELSGQSYDTDEAQRCLFLVSRLVGFRNFNQACQYANPARLLELIDWAIVEAEHGEWLEEASTGVSWN